MRFSLNDIAEIMALTLPKETLATIVAIWVGADDDDRLTEQQSEVACLLFETLCQKRPDAVALATGAEASNQVSTSEAIPHPDSREQTTHEKSMKFDVLLYPICVVKVAGVEADNALDAIHKAEGQINLHHLLKQDEPNQGVAFVEYGDDIAGYIVDEIVGTDAQATRRPRKRAGSTATRPSRRTQETPPSGTTGNYWRSAKRPWRTSINGPIWTTASARLLPTCVA
jgi:hypothetical protein